MAEERKYNGFYIGEHSDNPDELWASLYSQSEVSEIEIPASVDGKPVTKIFICKVQVCALRHLRIPSTVKEIYFDRELNGTFEEFIAEVDPENPWLTSDEKAIFSKDKSRLLLFTARKDKVYELPPEVRILDRQSFAGCDCQLEEIIFPEGLEEIGDLAFFNNENIRKLELPDSLRIIGEGAFYGSLISEIRLSKGLEVIKDHALAGVNRIEELYFHSAFKELGECALPRRVNSVKADDDNQLFAVRDGVLYSKDMKDIIIVSLGVNGKVTIPNGVAVLEDSIFSNNDKITEISLPPTLHTIEHHAFHNCSSLTKINLENVKRIDSSAFGNTKLTSVDLCCEQISSNAFFRCHCLKNVTLKNTRIIGQYAFNECSSLEEIILPEGLEKIEKNAFSDVPLKYVAIPKSVWVIEGGAFSTRYIEIYDTELSLVSGFEVLSNEDHLLIVRSAKTNEIKFAVPVFHGETIIGFDDRSEKLIMMLFGSSIENFDFTLYDVLFKAVYDGGNGNVRGKFMAAHYRLKYHNCLSGEAEKMYRSFIDDNAEFIASLLIKKEDFDIEKVKGFPYLDRIKSDGLDKLITMSEEFKRTELTEWLKSYKENRVGDKANSFGGQEKCAQNKKESKVDNKEINQEENRLNAKENKERLYNRLRQGEFEKFLRSAEEGSYYAQYRLALMYRFGEGTKVNEKLAAEWMTKSAEQGFYPARGALALYYKNGCGVEKNVLKAFELLSEAAEHDHAFSCNELGKFYEQGLGVAIDINKAVELYKKSAEGGCKNGIESLARCYEEGLGVVKDPQKAKELREKAIKY